MIPRIDRTDEHEGWELAGHWIFLHGGVDDSDHSVGNTACLLTLGLFESLSLCVSLSCNSKVFCGGKAPLQHWPSGLVKILGG
jgi:hypothetical protein